jgi:hypothetical protein
VTWTAVPRYDFPVICPLELIALATVVPYPSDPMSVIVYVVASAGAAQIARKQIETHPTADARQRFDRDVAAAGPDQRI